MIIFIITVISTFLSTGCQSCQFSGTFDPCSSENHKPFPYMEDRCPDCQYLSNDRNDLYDLDHDTWYGTEYNMTTRYVSPFGCGTQIPIWMNGTIPMLGEGVVNRTACVATFEKLCASSYSIKVKRCNLFYTVYCFSNLPNNQQRFCFDISMTTSTATSETGFTTLSSISSSTKPIPVLSLSTEVRGETRTSIKVPSTIRSTTTSVTTSSARQTIEPSSQQSISTQIKPEDYVSRDKEGGIQPWVIAIIAGLIACMVILAAVIIAMKRRLTKRRDDKEYDVPKETYVNDKQTNVYNTLDLPPLASREVSSVISDENEERYVTMNDI